MAPSPKYILCRAGRKTLLTALTHHKVLCIQWRRTITISLLLCQLFSDRHRRSNLGENAEQLLFLAYTISDGLILSNLRYVVTHNKPNSFS